MGDAAVPKPCCVCDGPCKHCTKCKSQHYCSKKCQLVYWYERGHKAQCKQMAADFQQRLLDSLTPENLIIKEALVTSGAVEDVAPAACSTAARASAVRATATPEIKAIVVPVDKPGWRRGTCAICLDLLPLEGDRRTFYECCCKAICSPCFDMCEEHDTRCPLCRTQRHESDAEWVRRVQKHVDEGNAEAQVELGAGSGAGVEIDKETAVLWYRRAAEQGYPVAQNYLGLAFCNGEGVAQSHEESVRWFRLAAAQRDANALYNLGVCHAYGQGVPQSHEEAVKWWRLAAAQGDANALYNLGGCYANGHGVPEDYDEMLRCLKRGAAEGHVAAAAALETL